MEEYNDGSKCCCDDKDEALKKMCSYCYEYYASIIPLHIYDLQTDEIYDEFD